MASRGFVGDARSKEYFGVIGKPSSRLVEIVETHRRVRAMVDIGHGQQPMTFKGLLTGDELHKALGSLEV